MKKDGIAYVKGQIRVAASIRKKKRSQHHVYECDFTHGERDREKGMKDKTI